jgi:hypothetical protein
MTGSDGRLGINEYQGIITNRVQENTPFIRERYADTVIS